MRGPLFTTVFALLVGALASGTASADCNPPCGPIPVVLEIKTTSPKYVNFGAADELVLEGVLSAYVNVDNDGYWYDPQNPPEVSFRVNRVPPWATAKVEPASFVVPIDDPQYLSNEGSDPSQVQFYWENPIKITITKQRDPTVEELDASSGFIRSDGTYRVTVSATSTSSLLASDVFGPNMGLQEGYGVKEVRVIPEINGVQWLKDEAGALKPADGVVPGQAKGNASAPAALLALLTLLGFALLRRR